jgi:hypothetical protein
MVGHVPDRVHLMKDEIDQISSWRIPLEMDLLLARIWHQPQKLYAG